MHPIERLRFVARAEGAPATVLVEETATALRAFAGDPQGLVTACRRIVTRQPASGPLWWLAARALTAPDAMAELARAATELADDETSRHVAALLPDEATVCVVGWPDLATRGLPRRGDLEILVVDSFREASGLVTALRRADVDGEEVPAEGAGAAAAAADLVLLETDVLGPDAFLAPPGSRAAAAVGREAGRPVWLVAGVGRLFPERMFAAITDRVVSADEPWEDERELVPAALVDVVVGPRGRETPAEARSRTDCPVAPELFGRL